MHYAQKTTSPKFKTLQNAAVLRNSETEPAFQTELQTSARNCSCAVNGQFSAKLQSLSQCLPSYRRPFKLPSTGVHNIQSKRRLRLKKLQGCTTAHPHQTTTPERPNKFCSIILQIVFSGHSCPLACKTTKTTSSNKRYD